MVFRCYFILLSLRVNLEEMVYANFNGVYHTNLQSSFQRTVSSDAQNIFASWYAYSVCLFIFFSYNTKITLVSACLRMVLN